MKLIVDISEEQYELVRHGNKSYTTELELMNAVAKGTPLKEWLSTFNTDSAPICFNKIQELKRECEKDERTTKS